MDNEKKKRLEKQLEEWKASPQLKEFQKALQQYSIHFSKILSAAEMEYKEAASFYQEWIGKKAIPQKEFFEWFFREKHDATLAELVKHSPEVRVMDIEEAAKWFVAEYRKNKQPRQLQEPQKPAPQAFGSELVEVVKNALEEIGHFEWKKNEKWKVRALFDALKYRKHIPDVTYKEDNFSLFFGTHFHFYISSTSLRTLPTTKDRIDREKRLKLEFIAIIPEK